MQPHDAGERLRGQHILASPVRERVGVRHRDRRRPQPCQQRVQAGPGRAEARATAVIGVTARELRVDGGIEVACMLGAQDQRRRHDRIEHGRANAPGVATQVLERDARAVRHADEVDGLDAERRADRLEVRDIVARGVEARIGVAEFTETAPGQVARDRGVGHVERERRFVADRLRAVQPVRATRAALIDQDHVALPQDRVESRREHRERFELRLARDAGQEHHGVRRRRLRRTRHPRDGEFDASPVRVRAVLGHAQGCATRGERGGLPGCGERARRELQRAERKARAVSGGRTHGQGNAAREA